MASLIVTMAKRESEREGMAVLSMSGGLFRRHWARKHMTRSGRGGAG